VRNGLNLMIQVNQICLIFKLIIIVHNFLWTLMMPNIKNYFKKCIVSGRNGYFFCYL